MKKIVFAFATTLALQAHAISWKVYGPCSEELVCGENTGVDKAINLRQSS